jgi:hypothetical protein
MLWDEYRPEFIVTLELILVLKKKKFLQPLRGNGDQGVEVSLTLVHSTVVREMQQYK